jgi:hypothetical protein
LAWDCHAKERFNEEYISPSPASECFMRHPDGRNIHRYRLYDKAAQSSALAKECRLMPSTSLCWSSEARARMIRSSICARLTTLMLAASWLARAIGRGAVARETVLQRNLQAASPRMGRAPGRRSGRHQQLLRLPNRERFGVQLDTLHDRQATS